MVTRRVAWSVALVATLTMTLSYFDRQTLAALAPSVTKALGISETEYGWLSSAFSIAYLVATPLSGWWIDRIGARRGLVGSVLVWTSFAALHAVVPGFGMLFALRIALGVAEGPSFPGSAQTVQRILPPAERERGFGVLFTGSSIGGMLAPLLAGFLYGIAPASIAGWRFAFIGCAIAGLIWIPLWIMVTRRADVRAQLDVVHDVATHGPRPTFGKLLKHPAMLRALVSIFAVAPIFAVSLSWGAKYLNRTFKVEQADVGHYLWLPPLMFDVGAILFGDLASRQRRAPGQSPRMLFGFAILLATTLALVPLARTPWESVMIIGVAMAGGGAVYTLTTADLLSRMPAQSISFAGGIMAGAQSLALIIVNPLIGASVDHYGNYDLVTIVLGLWAIPGTLFWLLWTPRTQ